MPVFRINILLANKKQFKEFHLVDGVELDTYYRHVYRLAKSTAVPIVLFDVVQISEFTQEATLMRANNLKRMSRRVPNVQPIQRMSYRRRRL